MRKLINATFNIFVHFIILVSLLYILSSMQARLDPSHIPSVFGFTPLTVVSGSMSPEIETGDMVIIKNGSENIKPGDVIAYKLEDVLVTHRVINAPDKNLAGVYITQGDANSIQERWNPGRF